jgi:predicted DNA-binding protein (MmcQ/YjbR family)
VARKWTRAYDPGDPVLGLVRRAMAGLPGVHEEETWGTLTLRVGRKLFGIYSGGLGGVGRRLVFKPVPREADSLRADPRFSVAPHLNSWLMLDLDAVEDWAEVAELLTDSFAQIAPKNLADAVGGRP